MSVLSSSRGYEGPHSCPAGKLDSSPLFLQVHNWRSFGPQSTGQLQLQIWVFGINSTRLCFAPFVHLASGCVRVEGGVRVCRCCLSLSPKCKYVSVCEVGQETRARVVWCGVVWCGVVWCGVVWCGVVWCGVAWWWWWWCVCVCVYASHSTKKHFY